MTDFSYNSKMTFGKFKGETIKDLIERNPAYLEWCLRNVNWFNFNLDFDFISEVLKHYPSYNFHFKTKSKLDEKNKLFVVQSHEECEWDSQQDYDNESIDLLDGPAWNYYNDSLDMDQQSEEFWNRL